MSSTSMLREGRNPRRAPRDARGRPPASLRWASYAVFVVAAVHLVALVLLMTHQDVIRSSVVADHPGWTGAQVARQTRTLVTQSLIPHIVLPLILTVRGSRLLAGRARGRGLLTTVLVIQVLAHATLPISLHELPGYATPLVAVQAFSLVFEVTALVGLWTTSASVYFRAARAGRR